MAGGRGQGEPRAGREDKQAIRIRELIDEERVLFLQAFIRSAKERARALRWESYFRSRELYERILEKVKQGGIKEDGEEGLVRACGLAVELY